MHRRLLLWLLLPVGLLVGYTAIYYGRLTAPIHAIAITDMGEPLTSRAYRFLPRYQMRCHEEVGAGQCQIELRGESMVIDYRFEPPYAPMGNCAAIYQGESTPCFMKNAFYPWRAYFVLPNIDSGISSWRLSVETHLAQMGLGYERYWFTFLLIFSAVIGVVAGIELMERWRLARKDFVGKLYPIAGILGGALAAYLCGYLLFLILFLSGTMLD